MLNNVLISNSFATLQLTDNVAKSLAMIEDNEVQHLAVIHQNKYIGTISHHNLLEENDDKLLNDLQHLFLPISVFADAHFLTSLQVFKQHSLSLIPVVESNQNFVGYISATNLLQALNHFVGADEVGGIIAIETHINKYSLGEISKLIETNGATVLQLNSTTDDNGNMLLTIKLNIIEIGNIVSTLLRHNYHIKYWFGEEQDKEEIQNNYQNLMHFLNI